jgi:tRNA pseudouridine38-40 synthase
MENSENHPSRRLKLVLEYDGADFVGWQIQPNGRTVQEILQHTLEKFLHQKVTAVAAGRTDSGVHARGQVVHVPVVTPLTCEKIRAALNGLLPEDITVHEVHDVPPDFHARYSARERRYTYSISTRRTALERKTVWHVRYPLSFELLQRCSEIIIGEHDFRAFTKADSEVDHHRCTVYRSDWTAMGYKLEFTIHANRFLHTMVRSLVGTMVEVARGYYSVDYFEKLLKDGLRNESGPTAPPYGLVLEEVVYG